MSLNAITRTTVYPYISDINTHIPLYSNEVFDSRQSAYATSDTMLYYWVSFQSVKMALYCIGMAQVYTILYLLPNDPYLFY